MLMRVVRGDSVHLRTELLREFHGMAESTPGSRTVGEIIDAADAMRLRRIQAEREQQAEADRLRAEQAAAERRARLDWLARNEESSWQKVESLIDTKKPAEYDTAVDLLMDLRAVSERQNKPAEFSRRFTDIRNRHQRKVSLLDRFALAGLS
jgi:aspartate carbamoyltransferase catalytic subunit